MVDVITTIITLFAGSAFGYVFERLRRKEEKAERDRAQEIAVMRLVLKIMYHEIGDGPVSASDFADFDSVYQYYHTLGGNGEIARMYNDLKGRDTKC